MAVAKAKVLTTEIALEASTRLFELGGTRSSLARHNHDFSGNARVHTLHDPVRWKYHVVGNWRAQRGQPATPRLVMNMLELLSHLNWAEIARASPHSACSVWHWVLPCCWACRWAC